MVTGRKFRSLVLSDGGNVAPIVALSLFALIGAGGIAFDYARLASLDTELQNAADQAALAAASQLDGQTGACARASAAAASLLQNQTLFANDGDAAGIAVTVASETLCDDDGSVRFYQSYDQETDTFGPEATTDAQARVVAVDVDPRDAFYAFTPVVGAFSTNDLAASAVASLGSAICKVPPVMMCNPEEPESNTDINFPFNPSEGDGLRLVIGSPDAPGNFGFLRSGEDGGAKEVAKTIGYDNPPSGCIGTNGVETEPGNMISVRAALNTRFDISENGELTCPESGTCSPSRNTRKDLVRPASIAAPGACGLSKNTGSENWHEALIPYRAPNDQPLDAIDNPMNATNAYPEVMGYPRDLCHAWSLLGDCGGGIIGDGVWDIDAYFLVNYGWNETQWPGQTLLDPTAGPVTRYDVYMWEMTNPTVLNGINTPKAVSGGNTAYSSPICRGSFPNGGIIPDSDTPDRRRISVAVVNCNAQNLKGHEENVQVLKWLDVFLVEPAIQRGNGPDQRTTDGDIYVEVIEQTSTGGTDTLAITRRDVPYLIR